MQKQRITPKNRRRDGPTGQLPHDIDMHLPHNATRRTTSHGRPQGAAKKKSVRSTQEEEIHRKSNNPLEAGASEKKTTKKERGESYSTPEGVMPERN
jgi:hypothetical protein